MDFVTHPFFVGTRGRLSSRFSRLRAAFVAPKRLHRPFLIIAALTAAAIAGLVAQKLTADAVLEDFEKSHLPSPRAWDHGLGALGFRSLGKPDEIHSASRKLPLRSGLKGAVWTTNDLKWIVIFGEDEASAHPFRIYCWGECRPWPVAWAPLSSMPAGTVGWRAYDSLLARLEKNPFTSPVSAPHRPKRRDTREIRY